MISFQTTPLLVLALVLATASAALAQSDRMSGSTAPPPAREGNIYDHKAHQPTQSDVGALSSAAVSKRQVEEDVQQLLRQTDRLDKLSEQDERLPPDPLHPAH